MFLRSSVFVVNYSLMLLEVFFPIIFLLVCIVNVSKKKKEVPYLQTHFFASYHIWSNKDINIGHFTLNTGLLMTLVTLHSCLTKMVLFIQVF